MTRVLVMAAALILLGGCAASRTADPFAGLRTGEVTVVWQKEYEFIPMPEPWKLLELDEDDYSIAFYQSCRDDMPGTYPCESTSAYAEEPFGYSRDLHKRQEEFFRRFLWAARVDFEEPRLKKIRALGGEALQAETIGHERVLQHQVLVRVVFARRGERVVAFYFTQWRPSGREFDMAPWRISIGSSNHSATLNPPSISSCSKAFPSLAIPLVLFLIEEQGVEVFVIPLYLEKMRWMPLFVLLPVFENRSHFHRFPLEIELARADFFDFARKGMHADSFTCHGNTSF